MKLLRGALATVVLVGFSAALLIFLLIAVSSHRSIIKSQEDARLVAHTHQVNAEAELLISDLRDAESGQRGFLLTGNEQYLEPFSAAVTAIPFELRSLRALATDNVSQQRRLDELEPLITERLELLKQGIDDRKARTRAAGQENLQTRLEVGKGVMNRIRDLVDEMQIEEKSLLVQRSQESAQSAQHTTTVIIAGNIASFLILFASFWLLRREVAQREAAELRARNDAIEIEGLYNNAPCGYHSLDKHGNFVRVNDTELGWLGYSRDEMLGKHFTKIVTPESARRYAGNLSKFRESGSISDVEYDLIRKDGTVLPVALSATTVHDAEGNYLMSRSTIFDITERRQSEQKLRDSNVFLDSVIDNIPSMVFVKDAEHLRFMRFNKAGQTLLGHTQAELIGKSDYDFFTREEADFSVAKDREAIAGGKLVDIPEEIIHNARGEERILHTRKIPVFDVAGNPQYLIGISGDVTKRRRAEEEIRILNVNLAERADQLEAANKELESFSYSVSHDLRSPLRAVDGYSQMLQEDYSDKLDEEGRRLLGVVRESSQRMGMLIDDLLAFSRLGRKPVAASEIEMNTLVADVLREITMVPGAKLPKFAVETLPAAWGDRVLLRQVWANLLSNAIKFSRTAQEPTVSVHAYKDDTENVYCITDNGAGFDMQYYNKLFGIFQRLHSNDEFPGTGVGLAIVHRLITRHGGRVWAKGKVNEGATFYFTLPQGEFSE